MTWTKTRDVMADVLSGLADGMVEPPVEFLREPVPGQAEIVVDGRVMTAVEVHRYNANLWRRLASQARGRAAEEAAAAIGFDQQAEFAEARMHEAQQAAQH